MNPRIAKVVARDGLAIAEAHHGELGGGTLGASLLAQGLVDRLYLFVAPVVIGPGGVEAFPSLAKAGSEVAGAFAGWRKRLEPVRFGNDTLIALDREVSGIRQPERSSDR